VQEVVILVAVIIVDHVQHLLQLAITLILIITQMIIITIQMGIAMDTHLHILLFLSNILPYPLVVILDSCFWFSLEFGSAIVEENPQLKLSTIWQPIINIIWVNTLFLFLTTLMNLLLV